MDAQAESGVKTAESSSVNEEEEVVSSIPDTVRIRNVLNEIRIDVYKEFYSKMARSLDIVRKNYGEGRMRIVPAYMISQILFQAIDWFWDKAKLSERCVGKLSYKGTTLYRDGMPSLARQFFCVGSALSILSNPLVSLKQKHRIDTDDILAAIEGKGSKRAFFIGFMLMIQQVGSFGARLLTSECLWACSCCGVAPPNDMLEELKVQGSGGGWSFSSADPVDLVNSLLSIQGKNDDVPDENNRDGDRKDDGNSSDVANSSPTSSTEKHKTLSVVQLLDREITETIPLDDLLSKISSTMPGVDLTIIAALLGRPGEMVEITPYRFTQTILLWRKTAIAIIDGLIDPPGSEYLRLNDLMKEHAARKAGKKRLGFDSVSCISNFEAVSACIDWTTSMKGVPISVLQTLTMMTRMVQIICRHLCTELN